MALPSFYNPGDQEIYAGGDKFVPQEQYRLGPYTPPEIMGQNTNTGITNTQAASPYIWPPQGGGGGGGDFTNTNKFGLNLDTMKTISQGKYTEKGGPANMYGGDYVKTDRQIAQDEHGNWKDVNTNQNVYHANMPQIKGLAGTVMDFMSGKDKNRDIYEGTWTGAEWDDEFDPTVAGKKLNTIQRWKAKKEFKAAQEKAAADKIIADQAIAGAGAAGQRRPGRGGSHMSRSVDQGGLGITSQQAQDVSDANAAAGMSGWGLAEGGRIGYERGRVVNPGGYAGEEEKSEFSLWKPSTWSLGGPESETNPTMFGTQNSLMNKTAIINLEKAIGFYEASGELDQEQQLDYELKLKQLEALIAGSKGQAEGGLIGYFDGGIARLL